VTQHAIGALNANLKDFGFVIIGVFLGAWVLSYLIYRFTDLDEVEVRVANPASPQ
jgi:high-affinity nickel-transport protein